MGLSWEHFQREANPRWSRQTPPALAWMRRGVLYTAIDSKTMLGVIGLLCDQGGAFLEVRGAIGPRLVIGGGGMNFGAYDRKAIDRNTKRPVSERPLPWRWGDEVWIVGTWLVQPFVIHFGHEDYNEIVLGSPGDEAVFREMARGWARSVARTAREVDALEVLEDFQSLAASHWT